MIDPSRAIALAETLTVFNRNTNSLDPWSLYPEQKRILSSMCDESITRMIILKIRQIGITQLCCYYAVLYALTHPHSKIAIVAQDHPTAKALVLRFKDMALQFGITFTTENDKKLVTQSGVTIDAYTANSVDSCRGKTYGLIIGSEAAYWGESSGEMMAALSPTLVGGGRMILESTASAVDTAYRASWEDDDSTWTKIFSGFEAHPFYRLEDPIDEDLYQELVTTHGFTSRPHAAWWHHQLTTEYGRDVPRMLREYPLAEAQAWAAATGRYIPIDPPLRPFAEHILHPSIHVFEQPIPLNYYVSAIDTGKGNGGDDTVWIIYNITTSTIAVSFCSNTTEIDDVMKLYYEVQKSYQPVQFYVEENGIGESTRICCKHLGLGYTGYWATEGKKYLAFLWAKNQVIDGLAADEHLARNAKKCIIRRSKRGVETLDGDKDYLAALGFIGIHEEQWESWRTALPPRPVMTEGQFDQKARMRAAAQQLMPNRRDRWKSK